MKGQGRFDRAERTPHKGKPDKLCGIPSNGGDTMTPKVYSSATPLEAANALARALLILRRTEAERMGFRLEETAKVIKV